MLTELALDRTPKLFVHEFVGTGSIAIPCAEPFPAARTAQFVRFDRLPDAAAAEEMLAGQKYRFDQHRLADGTQDIVQPQVVIVERGGTGACAGRYGGRRSGHKACVSVRCAAGRGIVEDF